MKRRKACLVQHSAAGTAGLTCVAAIGGVGRRVRAPPDEAPRDALPPGRVPDPLHRVLRRQRHGDAQEQDLHVSGPGRRPLGRDGHRYGHLWNGLMARSWVPPPPMPVRSDARQNKALLELLLVARHRLPHFNFAHACEMIAKRIRSTCRWRTRCLLSHHECALGLYLLLLPVLGWRLPTRLHSTPLMPTWPRSFGFLALSCKPEE